jgi:hypothetical protein
METTPFFRDPNVFIIPVGDESEAEGGGRLQQWFTWRVCTNCIAAHAKDRCSLWFSAMLTREPLRAFPLEPGAPSPDDKWYGWLSEIRENSLPTTLATFARGCLSTA